ncbi:uncharacterized protein LOC144433072 [Glandiceps talaboti]
MAYDGRILFNDTFNADVLNDFMPVATQKEIRQQCGKYINDVITVPYYRGRPLNFLLHSYDLQREWYRNIYDILIPDYEIAVQQVNASYAVKKTHSAKCAALISPEAFEHLRYPEMDKISDAIDGHMIRIPAIRNAISDVMPKLCGGKPIVSFHWRNKTGEMCRYHDTGRSRCDTLLQMQDRIVKKMAPRIQDVIKENGIGCFFVAYTPDEPSNILAMLSESFANIITMADVIALHNPYIDSVIRDGYFMSLLEQELCARTKIFIGNGKSNWSSFIFKERRAFDKGPSLDITEDFPEVINEIHDCFK